jgi:putative hydrolase of the HAD superfamily
MALVHYSFDLWFTLIKSNPSFKIKRVEYFFENFNFKKIPIEKIKFIFRQVDLMCNTINQRTGGNLTSDEMYLMVLYLINEDEDLIYKVDLQEIQKQMEKLFFLYSPTLFDENTYNVLDVLKRREKTLSILSNTAFIKGNALRSLLGVLKIEHFFNFQIYSDEIGVSKPNKDIFLLMHENINKIWNQSVPFDNIVHIGDNKISDSNGASQYGISTFLLNTNENNILGVLNL